MNYGYHEEMMDYGGTPYAANIERFAIQNDNFRTTIWTGDNLQMTLMCIPPCGEIGLEVHKDTDQFIRVEQGIALAIIGKNKNYPDYQRYMCKGDAVFIPAGTWHNITNPDRSPIKLSVMYAPPNHAKGTVHHTKAEADIHEQ